MSGVTEGIFGHFGPLGLKANWTFFFSPNLKVRLYDQYAHNAQNSPLWR